MAAHHGPVVAHKLVAKVAAEAAAELYELVMANNAIRAAWKAQHPGASERGLIRAFVKKNAPNCLSYARATLVGMLSDPNLDSVAKECIVEALALDASVPRDRRPPQEQLLRSPS